MAEDPQDEQDWAAHLTRRLEGIVELLRNYSLRPALGIVRFLVAGTVALLLGSVVVVALIIGLTRLFDTEVFAGRVWATDFLFGGMLMLAGGFLFRLSARRKDSSHG